MFGSIRQPNLALDADNGIINIDGACPSYRQNVVKAYFELDGFLNPGYVITSESFAFKIVDANGNKVVQTSGGMVHTTTPGTMNVRDWYASNRLVSALSEIQFAMQPLNPSLSPDVQMKVQLPAEDFEELPDPCEIVFVNQLVNDEVSTCAVDIASNTLIFSNLLKSEYGFNTDEWIEFSVNNIKMPSSSRPTGSYTIEFYQMIEGVYRLVDITTVGQEVVNIRALPGSLLDVGVDPLLDTTYTEDSMIFTFTLGHKILQNGFITIQLPPLLKFVNTPDCVSFSALIDQDAYCEFEKVGDDFTGLFTIRDGFKSGPYDQLETPLEINVSSIFTPRSVMPTTDFDFTTFDKDGYEIDTHATHFLPALRDAERISEVRLIQNNVEVGASTVYDFLMKSPYPLYVGDLLTLTIPGQAQTNLAKSFRTITGSSEQSFLSDKLNGVLLGLDSIEVRISLKDGVTEIPIGAEFGFQITSLENPESTRPSDPFHVVITDYQQNLVVTITEDSEVLADQKFLMQATQPAQLVYGRVDDSEPKQALEPTLVQMRLVTNHALPQHSKLRLVAPKQLGLPENNDDLKCWIDSSPFGELPCTFDRATYTFMMEDINPHGMLRGGTTLMIEIQGLINRDVAAPTESFTALTMTEDGYLIDELNDGLTVAANCDWPCWECPAGQPTQCLKCDTRPGAKLPLFFNGVCVDECPSNYFEMNGICSQCDAGCLECDLTSKKCLECHFGMFLLGNKCMDKCPTTHHGIAATKTCELCTPPCMTCEGSLTTCTSCDMTLPQSFFFRNECFESCPLDISVEDEGVCEECNSNCKTCHSSYSPDYCTSCYGDQFLANTTHTCVDECPAGISVANFDAVSRLGQTRTCDLCNDNCLTCAADDTEVCLECRAGLKMLETEKKCVQDCPVGTAEVWLPLTQDTVCAECAPGCTECEGSREHCTACTADFVFHDYSCLRECPTDFVVISEDLRTCVREREACPYGQAYNALGECELYLAECKVGYVLNSSETECIPEPGFHLPFAFLYGAIGWLIFIVRKKNRQQFPRENIVSQLLLGFTALQQLSYIVQLILAYAMDLTFVSGMLTFAMFAHYFVNALCLLAVHYLISDKPYLHWRDQYTRETRVIAAVSTLYSFKATRLLFSNFLRYPFFDAACENRYRSLLRPFFVLTMLGLVQTGTILIANAYTIWLLRWGYEIVTLSVSSIVLGLAIFALEIYEFVLHQRQEPAYLGVGDYFAGQKHPSAKERAARKKSGRDALRKSQIRVMSVMEEGEGIPQNTEEENSSIGDYTSMGGRANQSQKILLASSQIGGRKSLSDQKMVGQKPRQEKFEFENIAMGKAVKLDEHRIDFGEQGQAPALHAMIKKLDEHQRHKRVRQDLEEAAANDQKAFDGQEIPHSSDESEHAVERNFAVVEQYLDEGIRKKLLISGTKQKTRQFRQKRQHFEKHRRGELESRNGDKAYHSDFDDRHKTDLASVNPLRKIEKPLKSMITTVQLGPKAPGAPGYLEQLQDCSDGELERDKLLYDQFYVKHKKHFDQKARDGDLVPNAKLHQSFDEDVLREMYDDFGVCSDFESELSWISYPPNRGFLCDYYENNPVKQAENELFSQKIKVKFQYNNMYKASYDVPPKQKLNLKPSVRTQTLAADILPTQIEVGTAQTDTEQVNVVQKTINLDFDPFESEEEYVIEESEQLSAIDEAICGDLVDKVIYEGFSDLDSDAAAALETRQNLHTQDSLIELDYIEDDQQKKAKKHAKTAAKQLTKKRKREDTSNDFLERQHLAKQEPVAARVGLNGRATDAGTAVNFGENGGKLGDVYDTHGHLVYDKDYTSQQDDGDSVKAGTQLSARSGRSGRSGRSKGSARRSAGSKSESRKKSIGQPGSSVKPSIAASMTASDQERPDQIENQNFLQTAPLPAEVDEPEIQSADFQNDNFDDNYSANDVNDGLNKRERQMIKAYGPNVHQPTIEEQLLYSKQQKAKQAAQATPKKSGSTGKSRKRKRSINANTAGHMSPNRPLSGKSGRGLTDAQSQIELENQNRDNGILQLVISNDPNALIEEHQVIQQLKPESKAGDNSEFGDGTAVDQETRGGNLSSAHEGSSQNLHGGYASMGLSHPMHQAPSHGGANSSAVKAHQYLNNQWESDASNSQMYNQLSGLQARKMDHSGPNNVLDSPTQQDGVMRTDDEQNIRTRRSNLNQTEINGGATTMMAYGTDGAIDDPIQNWSDDGAAQHQQRSQLYERTERDEFGAGMHIVDPNDPFSRIGQSYPLNRKMTTGPQPFQSLGVTTKPYKARRKGHKNDQQLLADQRRAQRSMGSGRMAKLENIYIKHGIAQTAMKTTNQQSFGLPPRGSSIPRADSLTNEAQTALRRHGVLNNPRNQSAGIYKQSINSTSKVQKRSHGLRLHKQNFVEDGQNIINNSVFSARQQNDLTHLSGEKQLPRVKRELQVMNQLSNSASETNDLNMIRQALDNGRSPSLQPPQINESQEDQSAYY